MLPVKKFSINNLKVSQKKDINDKSEITIIKSRKFTGPRYVKTLVNDKELLKLFANKANLAWISHCYQQIDRQASVSFLTHDESKITFSFAHLNYNSLAALGQHVQDLSAIVQFPDVTGAWVGKNYNIKWKNYFETNFFNGLQVYLKSSPIQYNFTNFDFTGFGQSGPYVVFAALEFLKKYQPKKRPIVVTFGQPRIGNEIFAAFVQANLEIYRLTIADDLLPNIPIRGVKIFLKWNDEIEKPEKSLLIAYEQYRHFKPEFWIDAKAHDISEEKSNCECGQNLDPLVYKCFNTHLFNENPV
ncbi:hypothetical protein G9A89_000647 [Geosiphon pyriformis]|nr:hypothetical protein G9A89_000647 [Geosiphon pyriformis]